MTIQERIVELVKQCRDEKVPIIVLRLEPFKPGEATVMTVETNIRDKSVSRIAGQAALDALGASDRAEVMQPQTEVPS